MACADLVIAGPAIDDVIGQTRDHRVIARPRQDIIGIARGAGKARTIQPVNAVPLRVSGVVQINQIIASRALNHAIAQERLTALKAHGPNARRILGVKVIAGIGCEKCRVTRTFHQRLAAGAVRNAHRGIAVAAIRIADGAVDILDVDIATAQIGQHDLKAVGPCPTKGRDVQPSDDKPAGGGVEIPIDLAPF